MDGTPGASAPLSAKAWLHMLMHGGRWSAAEIGQIVSRTRNQADTMLWQLARRGYLAAYRGTERKNARTYGVTAECKVPAGVSLQDVMKANQGAAE